MLYNVSRRSRKFYECNLTIKSVLIKRNARFIQDFYCHKSRHLVSVGQTEIEQYYYQTNFINRFIKDQLVKHFTINNTNTNTIIIVIIVITSLIKSYTYIHLKIFYKNIATIINCFLFPMGSQRDEILNLSKVYDPRTPSLITIVVSYHSLKEMRILFCFAQFKITNQK